MIPLTRIDGTTFYLNPDQIEMVEATHDTHVTLTNGHKYICADAPDVIAERIAAYRRECIGVVGRSA